MGEGGLPRRVCCVPTRPHVSSRAHTCPHAPTRVRLIRRPFTARFCFPITHFLEFMHFPFSAPDTLPISGSISGWGPAPPGLGLGVQGLLGSLSASAPSLARLWRPRLAARAVWVSGSLGRPLPVPHRCSFGSHSSARDGTLHAARGRGACPWWRRTQVVAHPRGDDAAGAPGPPA